jgi:hypothetical protein
MFNPLNFNFDFKLLEQLQNDPWDEWSGIWYRLPAQTKGIIHFLGGAFIGTAPHLAYRSLLEGLAASGYAVIATPFLNTFEHQAIARDVLNQFETLLHRLMDQERLSRDLPIYGLGHSMGCKLHLLLGSLYQVDRAGNIFMAFNNYPVERSIPFAGELRLRETFNLDFTPSPAETLRLVQEDYAIARNLLIQFRQDEIDQTADLVPLLEMRFGRETRFQCLTGNHLTPINQTFTWQAGKIFSPVDAIAQRIKQEVGRDLTQLQNTVIHWLK